MDFSWADWIQKSIEAASDLGGVISLLIIAYGTFASFFLWRNRKREHKYTSVYFPTSNEDFYRYYTEVISKAKKAVYLTSDGFNMKNPNSRRAAEKMNKAQEKAIERGAKVYRYQLLETMHLNWIDEICRMKQKHGDQYVTICNPYFESVGNFCVIDPDTRNTVFEFMLPAVGGFGQATQAGDFGFIHGHQRKSARAKDTFEEILDHPRTVEITSDTAEGIRKELWDKRVRRQEEDQDYPPPDEEIIQMLRRAAGTSVPYTPEAFASATAKP